MSALARQNPTSRAVVPVPARCGIGLRHRHYSEVFEQVGRISWVEVHTEELFSAGGALHECVERLANHCQLSLHGVGLSLGSTDPISAHHLARVNEQIDRYQPRFVSEHLSWSSINGTYINDLLPLPYTEESLRLMVNRVSRVQDYLGRQVLIENISAYLSFKHSTICEAEFLTELARQSGCGILLDVNNLYVNAFNLNYDANDYLSKISASLVGEIHVAGHLHKSLGDFELLIDTHDRRVSQEVWNLYQVALSKFGPVPTLIEWDTNVPDLSVLIEQANIANRISDGVHRVAA